LRSLLLRVEKIASGDWELEKERDPIISRQNMLPRIYLIRHGETEWSLSGQHTSRTDIPLTARGEEAARELGQRLRDIQFARVLTSPRQRARRTCELAWLKTMFDLLDEVERLRAELRFLRYP
jgi:hypothetical protein